jgi:hypothetical protein
MNAARCTLMTALMAMAPTVAWSAQFACKPPNGTTIYRDTPPAECGTVQIRELNPDGSTRRTIEPPLTPEQRRDDEEKKQRREACIRKNQEQKRRDASLLATYPSEDALLAARQRGLADQKTLIDQQDKKLRELNGVRRHLDNEAEFRPKGALAEELDRNFKTNTALQDQAQRAIDHILTEMERTNERFDLDLSRYRELTAGTAKPATDCGVD